MATLPNSIRVAKRREASRREIVEGAWTVAHRTGLAALTLRDVAAEVGMQAPSLYSHFPGKHAIYDAMFADAWATYLTHMQELAPRLPKPPRARLRAIARDYVDFACADLPRRQIMDVRIPDFTPSPDAYAVAAECFRMLTRELAATGVRSVAQVDIYTAMLGGVISQQLANDPGGNRWTKLVPRLIDMYADAVGIPKATARPQRERSS